MPLYSDSNYYYSGGSSQLYSPYYPQSTYSSPTSPSYSSSYNRSFGGSYSLPLAPPRTPTYSHTHGLSSRYQPMLTTITETTPLISARHHNHSLLPLTRIQSPKYTTYSSPGSSTTTGRYIPPRPIAINTADIDVSSTRYRKRQEAQNETLSPSASVKRAEQSEQSAEKSEEKEAPKSDKQSEPRAARTTIKRNRAVVRLSTIRSRSKDRNEKSVGTALPPEKASEPIQKKVRASEVPETVEHRHWREKLAADLELLNTKAQQKSPGELMRERYLIQHAQDDAKASEPLIVEKLPELVVELDPVDHSIRRLSIPQCPTFHDICEDISSDKIDDDLNAGELRRRASLIQEQEQELLNQLQKSASGSFQLIHLERRCSQDSLPDENIQRLSQRKSKKSKKIRHKITAIVDIDNPPVMPVLVEKEEEGLAKTTDMAVKSKFSFNVDAVEEHHEIHKVFKLPKKRSVKRVAKPKAEQVLPEGFMHATPKMKTPPKSKNGNDAKTYISTAEIFTFDQKPAGEEEKDKIADKEKDKEQAAELVPKPEVEAEASAMKKDATLKTATSLDSAEAKMPKKQNIAKLKKAQSMQAAESATLVSPKINAPKFKTTTQLELVKPKTAAISTIAAADVTPEPEQKVATPKPIRKFIQKSDSGEDFWTQIGTRETLYMTNRKKTLLETQWQKREDLLQAQTVEEVKNLEEIKNVVSAQKELALNQAEKDCKTDEKSQLERSHSNECKKSPTKKLAKSENKTLNEENKDKEQQVTASKSPKKKLEQKVNKKVSPVKKLKSPLKKATSEDNAVLKQTTTTTVAAALNDHMPKAAGDSASQKPVTSASAANAQKDKTIELDSKMTSDKAKIINKATKENAEREEGAAINLQSAMPKLTQANTTTKQTATDNAAAAEQSITNTTAKIPRTIVPPTPTTTTTAITTITAPPKINIAGQHAKSPEQQHQQKPKQIKQTLVEQEILKAATATTTTTATTPTTKQTEINAKSDKLINNNKPDANNNANAQLPTNAAAQSAQNATITKPNETEEKCTKMTETNRKPAAAVVGSSAGATATIPTSPTAKISGKLQSITPTPTPIQTPTPTPTQANAKTSPTTGSAINADQFITQVPPKSATSPTKTKAKIPTTTTTITATKTTTSSPSTSTETQAKAKTAAAAATAAKTAAVSAAPTAQDKLSTIKQIATTTTPTTAATSATKAAVGVAHKSATPSTPQLQMQTAATITTTTTKSKTDTTPCRALSPLSTAPPPPPSPTLENNELRKSPTPPPPPPRTTTTAIATGTPTENTLNNNTTNLSKFATVSNLAQCLQDVDADLDDYIPSSAENSSDENYSDIDTDSSFDYSSAYGCVNPTESMKKKLKQRRKKEKRAEQKAARFDPQKKIKIDPSNKCYVKDEAPRYPLVATPRPLWKRENIVYSDEDTEDSEASSDEGSGSTEETTDDSEECSSEEFEDDLRRAGGSGGGSGGGAGASATSGSANTPTTPTTPKEKSNIIRMSTCSNDSGFEGGTAPSSPKKMLECDVNCHKKCERLTANLCGVNQKLIVEALAHVKRGARENRDSPSTPPSSNPAYKIEATDEQDETSYTYSQFQKSGRFTPPATVIPRFKNYNVDDFHFLAVLGKGSFGKVLLAELRDTTYYYAIKCLKKDVVLEDDDVDSTLIERKVLALGTKHPYLCHLFCTFQTESHLFFVMEYLNGGDLMFHIQESGRFSEERARFYGAEIISGLKFLHKKGIIYRDLKLDNVLLDYEGHVRIADFGMCKLQIYLDKTADSFCGTPDYMAPEIIKGEKYNQNVDWWSFGVLLYEMLIGQSPFSGCDEDELFWSICNEIPWFPVYISAEATSILKGLLEKDYTKRIGSQYSPAGDIADHIFFRPIDWKLLEKRQIEPPYKPQVKHPLDTQYFDRVFTRERVRLTPIDKDILQSMDQKQFLGFTYTNPHITLD